jgi:hypothetical protein
MNRIDTTRQILNSRILIAATALALFTSSCGSDSNSTTVSSPGLRQAAAGASVGTISVTGTGAFADGTPVASKNVQIELILDGANLFQAGYNGCLPTPAHVAGTVIQSSTSTAQGGYSVSVPITSLQAAVVHQCSLQQLNSSQIEGLTIRASILADATTCPAYCSAQGDPSETCVSDCTTGNRTLNASQAVSASQVVSAIQGGSIQVSQNLTFDGLGPALETGGGPDLTVDGAAAQSSAHVDQESFDNSSCEVAEACVRAPGLRTVMRFDGTIENVGNADLVIGSPQNSGLFTTSSCHNVALLKNIMLYELVDPSSGDVVTVSGQQVIGRKQGFCMMDIEQINATAPQGQYNCQNQGITRGWADIYDSALDCQFLDITGVPAGDYQLRLTVNPDGLFQETNTSNNTVSVPVSVPDVSTDPVAN